MRTHPQAVRRALVAYLGLSGRVRRPFAQTVADLGAVQMDPMRVVAQAHLLTVRLRRGPTTETALSRALGTGGVLEARLKERCLVAAQDLPAAVAEFHRIRAMNLLEGRGLTQIAHGLLATLERRPRYSRELVSEHRVASFWDEDPKSMKATTMALDILSEEGRVIVTGRRRGERRYDLPQRLFPAWEPTIADPARTRFAAALHYGRTMGIFQPSDPYLGWIRGARRESAARRALVQELCAAGEWREMEISGVDRRYLCTRVFAELCADPPPIRGVKLLSPLDNLLWDRQRLRDLFDFSYTWEAYTPAVKRKVGPYGMPVLMDGCLVAELDARRDEAGALHWRLVERARLRTSDLRRIERAVAALARDVGTVAATREQTQAPCADSPQPAQA